MRGPTDSSQRPANAADNPSETIATVNTQTTSCSDQSPAALVTTPNVLINAEL